MSNWTGLRRVFLTFTVVGIALVGVEAAGAVEDGQREGNQDKKPKVVQIDMSKLPADLAKALERYLSSRDEQNREESKGRKKDEDRKPNPETKTLTLSQAIAVAERLTKGTAYRAETRNQDGVPTFRIEIQDNIGRRQVDLSATGEILKNNSKKRD